MCDETTFAPRDDSSEVTRRGFGALAIAAGIAASLPRAANALDAVVADVDVPTPDGLADCYLARPVEGSHPGVVIWPDARGMRGTYRDIAERLAGHGYVVLVVNPYYRGHRGPVLPAGADPSQGDTMSTLRPLLAELSPATELTDAVAMVEFVDALPAVDTSRRLGTLGFCLGGPATLRTAARFPGRVGAGASFHGVRLATAEPTSPHLLVPSIDASFLFAIAEDDDARDPGAKITLRAAFDAAGLDAEIEVYAGAMHSWTTADSPVHNPAQAERAWSRLIERFGAAL